MTSNVFMLYFFSFCLHRNLPTRLSVLRCDIVDSTFLPHIYLCYAVLSFELRGDQDGRLSRQSARQFIFIFLFVRLKKNVDLLSFSLLHIPCNQLLTSLFP